MQRLSGQIITLERALQLLVNLQVLPCLAFSMLRDLWLLSMHLPARLSRARSAKGMVAGHRHHKSTDCMYVYNS
jgi:hypothetical protein